MKIHFFVALTYLALCTVVNGTLAQDNSFPEELLPDKPGLHARLFDAHLQYVSETCAGNADKTICMNEFWKIADVSNDDQLSVAEITRILRVVAGKFAYQDYVEEYVRYETILNNSGVAVPPQSEETMVVLGIATTGPLVSHALMSNFDYDDNGLLSKNEILHDIAIDINLSSVDTLPEEVKSRVSRAVGLLLQFLMKQ